MSLQRVLDHAGIFALIDFGMHKDGTLDLDILVASCVTIVTWPFAIAGMAGGVLLDSVSRVIIVERIRPITARVRSSTPANADFDDLLTRIASAQELVATVRCHRLKLGTPACAC